MRLLSMIPFKCIKITNYPTDYAVNTAELSRSLSVTAVK